MTLVGFGNLLPVAVPEQRCDIAEDNPELKKV
jgi:hypothetical protein